MERSSPTGRWIRADFHSHTRISADAWTTPAELVERARETGIDRIAVTDHGEIDGALEARSLDPERVIVGEEIRCACRTELIGLYLTERIPQFLPLEEVVERIRDQGGLVYAPHPFAYALRPAFHAARALAVADALEAVNSRAFYGAWNRKARRASIERGIPAAAGSDAHFPWEIGRAYTELPPFDSAAELRDALRHAHPVGVRLATPMVHVASVALKAIRRTIGDRRAGRTANRPSAAVTSTSAGASEAA